MEEENEDMINSLLAVANEELNKFQDSQSSQENLKSITKQACEGPNNLPSRNRILTETDIFQFNTNTKSAPKQGKSVIHEGDTDSSDDEGNRNYEDQKYNEYGREIKSILSDKPSSSISVNSISSSHYGVPKKRVSNWSSKSSPLSNPKKLFVSTQEPHDVLMDPIFGMRIVKPLISSTVLVERMQNRLPVHFSQISRHILLGSLKDKDWVICGVVASKSPPKTSQKGTQFSVWLLTDLKDDIKTVSVFLFGSSHSDLKNTAVGTVIGILNPGVLDRKDGSKDEATLSIDTAQKVMVFGQSKDFGTCKSLKKNGDKCTAIVNLHKCEYCVYHIKQEYQKCSKRSELQANFAGKGLLNLRNKVLGKNEVFYAGKSYTAIPAKKSTKMETRDNNIMRNLNGASISNPIKAKNVKTSKKGAARQLDVNPVQRARDLELLKKLGGTVDMETIVNFSGTRSEEVSLESSKANALNVINKLKAKNSLDKVISKPKENSKSLNGTPKEDSNSELLTLSEVNFDELNYSDEEIEGCSKKGGNISETKVLNKSLQNKESGKSLFGTEHNKVNETFHSEPWKNKEGANGKIGGNLFGVPKLSNTGGGGFIDLSRPISSRHVDRAKLNALKYVQAKGAIKKIDPNSTKSPTVKKRKVEDVIGETNNGNSAKKSKLAESEFISDRFKKMMAMTSRHADLLERHDENEKEKYFKRLEVKEQMEEKMVTTYKVKCKAVRCLTCKYTSFSASDLCKSERHPLKVLDATKRFFKCSNCQNRTVSLDIIPTRPCSNCGSSKWERTGMMKEKIAVVQHNLCIRDHSKAQHPNIKFTMKIEKGHQVVFLEDLLERFGRSLSLKVCKKFNEIGSKLLSRGFIQLEKRHVSIFKRVKSSLPRRESERKNHPLARHSDILQAVETRMSMLNMTYMRYIQSKLICFIPGKVLDEIKSVLDLVDSNKTPPRTHQLLQELRDLSSMAMEHFDEHILPRCKEQLEQKTGSPEKILKELEVVAGTLTPYSRLKDIIYKNVASTSKSTRLLIQQQFPQAISTELYKVQKVTKNHKHHISYLTQNTQKLCIKLRKQTAKLRIQSAKIREQERKIQEQNSKILEQDAALTEIRKHLDEWDQKYKDLTSELVRARDEILLKSSSTSSPSTTTTQTQIFSPFKSNIKPRVAHFLPKSYLDLDRKRKSSSSPELPPKRSRSPGAPESGPKIELKVPEITPKKNSDNPDESNKNTSACSTNRTDILGAIYENLLKSSPIFVKARKRKMTEDIDLK